MQEIKYNEEHAIYYYQGENKGRYAYVEEFIKNILYIVNILNKEDGTLDALNPLNWKEYLPEDMIDFERYGETGGFLQIASNCICSHCITLNCYWEYKNNTRIAMGDCCVFKRIGEILASGAKKRIKKLLKIKKEKFEQSKLRAPTPVLIFIESILTPTPTPTVYENMLQYLNPGEYEALYGPQLPPKYEAIVDRYHILQIEKDSRGNQVCRGCKIKIQTNDKKDHCWPCYKKLPKKCEGCGKISAFCVKCWRNKKSKLMDGDEELDSSV
jgi:hypothetical protein